MLSLLCIIYSNAQKIVISTDDFTGDTIIKTSWEKIYSGGMTGKDQTRIQIQQINGTQYILFRVFTNRVVSISQGSEIMFKTADGIVKALATDYAIAEPGAWSPNAINKNLGILFTTKVDLSLFSGEIEKIRIPFNDGNLDLSIKDKEADKISKMIQSVLNAPNK